MRSFEDSVMWTAPDGARLAVYRQPASGTPRAALLLVHGWGEHSACYGELARWFGSRGVAVWSADLRGHGRSPGVRGHIERFAQYLSDVAALRKLMAAELKAPQLLLGVSYGGFIVLRYLETAPPQLAGAVAVTPYLDLATPASAWKVRLARAVADLLPRLPISTGLDWSLTTRNVEVWTAMRDDPLSHQRITPRAWRETVAAQQVLREERHRIVTPLLVLLAGDDRIVSTAAAEQFAGSLRAPVTLRLYPDFFHSLFHEPGREAVYDDLAAWADTLLGGAN